MGGELPRLDGATGDGDRVGTLSADAIETSFDRLVDDFQGAITDDVTAHRLKSYDFNAVIRVAEATDLELWCLFHGVSEVGTSGRGASADVEVLVPAALLDGFWDRQLALDILEGHVTYTGRVRRLLTVMPVIRAAALRRQNEAVR